MQTKPTFTTDAQRSKTNTDRDHREPSPSTGWRETAEILDAPNAHAVEPVDAFGCSAHGCHASDDLHRVTVKTKQRVLCLDHVADFLDREVRA